VHANESPEHRRAYVSYLEAADAAKEKRGSRSAMKRLGKAARLLLELRQRERQEKDAEVAES
jgi:hypothetical protein